VRDAVDATAVAETGVDVVSDSPDVLASGSDTGLARILVFARNLKLFLWQVCCF
jgi:hypothetical protein